METLTEQFDAEKIYQDFYPKVYQYLVNRMGNIEDAEDMAQTVFLKIYTKLDTFDASKSSLSTWIFNITRNTLIDHQRSMSLRIHEEIPETLADQGPDMLDNLIMEQELERLADALEILTEEERDLIILHYYKEYTLLKVAEMMRRPYGQIKRLHMKALQKMKLRMG
ncbi:MAG: RNA polymerase sigma factor [Oscillospiraceae bacterium]|nr:RNA polymerase sigma factor [Oscillospiraceae bacterium]